MLRKTLTTLSLIGLLLSVGLWVLSYWGIAYVGQRYVTTLEYGQIRMHRDSSVSIVEVGIASSSGFEFETDWLPLLESYPDGACDVFVPLSNERRITD